jgi:hypothetical protein
MSPSLSKTALKEPGEGIESLVKAIELVSSEERYQSRYLVQRWALISKSNQPDKF